MKENAYGREIVIKKKDLSQFKSFICIPAVSNRKCCRCDMPIKYQTPCSICLQFCGYCVSCINLGLLKECDYLVSYPEPKNKHRHVVFDFKGTLSNEQEKLSKRIEQAALSNEQLLVYAVTGAGKTEMIYNGIHRILEEGGRVCLSAPRVDVCIELSLRLKKVFPDENIAVLYGANSESYRYSKLVICTTHQLLRFKHAFDLLFIDEVDSFPFSNNPILTNRIEKVLKEKSSLILLTATPSKDQLKKIKKGTLSCVTLPARYHKHPLVVPKSMYIGFWKKKPKVLFSILHQFINKNQPFLVFLPNIDDMHVLEKQLKKAYPNLAIASVHAQDSHRYEKIQSMRDNQYDCLLTTTILERGVTFKHIHVIVVDAHQPIFTTASLVQIAGRVGRTVDAPSGLVYFLHNGASRYLKKAIKEIEHMNKLAKERGLIL
ncbi:DEAD/DEAH box helicase family protein [Carnobacteriaceae bacterium zg-84]|uniref:DEAD/DEAH box helicase n=1 Tax=Granulicatella sp. zg-84 TaxID=2678503 RepID=UPI0013C03345|nr:helicase-related protein [Granulicatella sp. zg-84]NEW66380.1 DEAD/DEAH box helicase [Granulicatella sp. zg-84]QMI86447.1 DEAD/DEAH box helicase family protein [Carnobacteriaceae bacterium zg-84]